MGQDSGELLHRSGTVFFEDRNLLGILSSVFATKRKALRDPRSASRPFVESQSNRKTASAKSISM